MIRCYNYTKRRLLTVIACIGATLLTLSACTPEIQPSAHPNSTRNTTDGSVAIFTPSDGLNLSPSIPLSTWDTLTKNLVKSLKKQGFTNNSIRRTTSGSSQQQSQDVQDFVVSQLTALHSNEHDKQERLSNTTIILAPWAASSLRQYYGELVTTPTDLAYQKTKNEPANQSNTASTNDTQTHPEQDLAQQEQAQKRLSHSLRLARKAGMHVMLLARKIPGFQPDVFMEFSTPERIGQMQAETLVHKLALNRASKESPKSVEVLLPCHRKKTALSLLQEHDETYRKHVRSDFASRAFRGIWKVLQPYYANGTLVSPSHKLHAKVSTQDWENVAFDADAHDAVKKELRERLLTDNNRNDKKPANIDGIIALEDHIALAASETLQNLGYHGSSADINPSITLPDVIGNFIGKRDIRRRAVPLPRSRDKSSHHKHIKQQEESLERDVTSNDNPSMSWPIITGYGACKDAIPGIVNGQQWMTTVEHHQQIITDMTQIVLLLNRQQSLNTIAHASQQTVEGVHVTTLQEPLLAVSATNLKSQLIDPGYITLADAGL